MKSEADNPYIVSIDPLLIGDDLITYVNEKNASSDALLLGIFETSGMHHIGNIQFEPINFNSQTTWLGILIGDTNWRGKGVGSEILRTSMEWMRNEFGIKTFHLGVDPSNLPAVKLYRKVGFSEDPNLSELPETFVMSFHFQ